LKILDKKKLKRNNQNLNFENLQFLWMFEFDLLF